MPSNPSIFFSQKCKQRLQNEILYIYTVNLDDLAFVTGLAMNLRMPTLNRQMRLNILILTHPRINKKWVRVALKNGDRCFIVRLNDEIAGLGWVSLVNGVGRLHSLFVQSQFRRMGIGEDILNARLLWLKSNRAHSAFCEISRYNVASAGNVIKAHMSVSGQVYQYFKKSP
jgi:GNAT superfamily N-acetyltransferase